LGSGLRHAAGQRSWRVNALRARENIEYRIVRADLGGPATLRDGDT